MLRYSASVGVDVDSLLGSLGVDPRLAASPDTYIAAETYLRIQAAARLADDPCFGLHMGQFAEAGSWSIVGYLMMNCSTLGEVLKKSDRYSRIIGNMIESRLVMGLGKIKVVFFTPLLVPSMSRHCYESALASIVKLMRSLTGIRISPIEVAFIYPSPNSVREYEDYFGCPVLFDRKENSFTFESRVGETPILLPNSDLLGYFENYARDLLTWIEGESEEVVAKIILVRLDDPALSIRQVAKELSVSIRTLQNRLGKEGIIFSKLMMEIRERLAKQRLRENFFI